MSAAIATTDYMPLTPLLSQGEMLDEHTCLLRSTKSGRKAQLFFSPTTRHAFQLGMALEVTPVNMAIASEEWCLSTAQSFGTLCLTLPNAAGMQMIMHVAPASDVPGWEDLRRGIDDPRLDIQRQAMRHGMHHQAGKTRSQLRRVTTLVTLSIPVSISRASVAMHVDALYPSESAALAAVRERYGATLTQHMYQLRQSVSALREILNSLGCEVKLCDGAMLHGHLSQIMSPMSPVVPPFSPLTPLREQICTEYSRLVPGGMEIGGWRAQLLSLLDLPLMTYPGILSGIRTPTDTNSGLHLWNVCPDWPMTLVLNIASTNMEKLITQYRMKMQMAHLHSKGMLGAGNQEAQEIRDEIDDLLRGAFSRGQFPYWTRFHIMAWEPVDTIDSAAEAFSRAGQAYGLPFIPEPRLGSELFFHCLPLGFNPAVPSERYLRRSRSPIITKLAHMFPLYGDFRGTGTPFMVYLNRRGETVNFSPRDIPTAMHGVILGKSGSGKSYCSSDIIYRARSMDSYGIIVDFLPSYRTLVEALKGEYIALSFHNRFCVNPFEGNKDEDHHAFILLCLSTMASGGDPRYDLNPERRGLLSQAIGEYLRRPSGGPVHRIGEFVELLHDAPFTDHDLGPMIARQLAPYYGRGDCAGFFDGPSTFVLDNKLTCIEQSGLVSAPQLQTILSLVLMHYFTVFFTDPQLRDVFKILLSDETWSQMKLPAVASFYETAALTYRKLTTSLLFVTQFVKHLTGPAGEAILGTSGYQIFFEQNHQQVEAMRQELGFSDHEVRLFQTVRRYKGVSEAYMRLDGGATGGVIRIVADPYLHWAVTQDPEERKMREDMIEKTGDLETALLQLSQDNPGGLYRAPANA